MPTEASSFDLQDPLHGYSYLSLFPRTCRTLGVDLKPTELSDLHSVHNVLKKAGLKETSRHIEQARMIVESSSEDMVLEANVNAAVLKESGDVGLVDDEIARKRRPGLGRMQSKFNINRKLSQPAVIKELKLDITKLKDPEEFFLAHERLEHAQKELRKQSGILSEIDVGINDMPLTARPRRPGIPGRSKATYKHHCPSVVSNDELLKESFPGKTDKGLNPSLSLLSESSFLSQENSKENHGNPFSENTLPEANVPVEDKVLGGSVSEVNGLLDEILSGTYDHLNSESHLTLLQEQLQLKPINIENLSLPKLPDIPKYDFKISGNLSKPRKSIHEIQAAFCGMNNKTPVKSTLTPGSVRFSASPTPPKSPFANLSSLKKHILQLNRSQDSFSEFNADPCSVSCSSPVNGSTDVQGDAGSNCKMFSEDKDSAISDKSLHHELLQESGDLPDPVDDISKVVAKASSILSNKSVSAMGEENGVPGEPHSTTEYYNVSQSNERSDTMMQSGNAAAALNSSEPDPCVVDQQSSPTARSHGNLLSTISNQYSAQHEDSQADGRLLTECDVKRTTNKKTRRKIVPEHQSTNVRTRRGSVAADDTDTHEQESRRIEVQPDHVSTETNLMQHESSLDNSRSIGVELHEKQSMHPDTCSALQKVHKFDETSVNRKRKGKSSPVKEHDVRVEARKKQKRKGDGIVAPVKESRGDQTVLTSAGLHDNQSQIPNNHPEQQEVEQTAEDIHPRKKAKRKELLLRKSIAVAGTSFEAGVRKSNRRRSRPLEFWKGERYLYARLEPDSTLPTLIGVKKYDTPAKKVGKEVLKVKDYVDGEKYRELIDLAALH